MSQELEEGSGLQLDFNKLESIAANGCKVVPVAVQNADDGQVIMIGYANAEALAETQRLRRAVFWSTSRNELWVKGASSGDVLELMEIRTNCEQNSLLYLVRLIGSGACHTRLKDGSHRPSCYYRKLDGDRLEDVGAPPSFTQANGC